MSHRVLIAILMACVVAEGCAGISTYHVSTFYDAGSKQVLCCTATITSGRDVSVATVHVAKTGDDVTIDFSETGVSATAPIAANAVTASAVSAAISNVAVTAAKFSLKP